MARQIQYDPIALKRNLLSVFWGQGYAETSLCDLEDATGLNRRQLYNGVGDKRSMFLQALDDFSEVAGREFLSSLEADDAGLNDIEALLWKFVSLVKDGNGPRGCMVCSTSQEEIAADPDVRTRIDAYFERIRAAYENALTRADARGETDLAQGDIERRAEALLGTHVALCILGRAGRSPEKLELMVQQALDDIR